MDSNKRNNLIRYFKNITEKIIFFFYKAQAKHRVDPKRHSLFISECTYTPWRLDSEFIKFQDQIKDYTLVDLNKQYLAYSYVKQLSKLNVDGDYLEVGVWRGGVSALIGLAFKKFSPIKRKLYLADTYEGMPSVISNKDNFYKGGELADTSEEIVKSLFSSCNLLNVRTLKGYFPQDTSMFIESEKFAYVHIDVDIYESAKQAFEWAWPKMSTHGLIVFDDYGYSPTEGVTKFVDEYVSNLKDALFIFNMGGQAVVVKC